MGKAIQKTKDKLTYKELCDKYRAIISNLKKANKQKNFEVKSLFFSGEESWRKSETTEEMEKMKAKALSHATYTNRFKKKTKKALEGATAMEECFEKVDKLDDYRISPALLEELEKLAGFKVDVDVCTDNERSNSLAPLCITQQEDTLRTKLRGLKFLMNCPYSFIMPFVRQAELAKEEDSKTQCLLILPLW